jgi:hypothetical protein
MAIIQLTGLKTVVYVCNLRKIKYLHIIKYGASTTYDTIIFSLNDHYLIEIMDLMKELSKKGLSSPENLKPVVFT